MEKQFKCPNKSYGKKHLPIKVLKFIRKGGLSKTEFFEKYPSFDYRKEGYSLALTKYQNQLHNPIEDTTPKNCTCKTHKKDSKSCKTKKKKVSRKYKANKDTLSSSSSPLYFVPRTPTPPASPIFDSRVSPKIMIDLASPLSIEFLHQEELASCVKDLNRNLLEEVVKLNTMPVPKKF